MRMIKEKLTEKFKAICKMAKSEEQDQNCDARCVYGLVFFGVPHLGIRIEHWLPMVKNQPNQALIQHLRPDSDYLRVLGEDFAFHFRRYSNSKILSIYETKTTKTATVS